MQKVTRKVGFNRGQKRIWLEGKYLAAEGWLKGAHYVREVTKDHILLTKDPASRLKVAGMPDRPVIDMVGKWVTEWAGKCTEVDVEVTEDRLKVTRK